MYSLNTGNVVVLKYLRSVYASIFQPDSRWSKSSSRKTEWYYPLFIRVDLEIIRAYQTKKAQEKWGMSPLPIAKNDMNTFEDQVFCTKDFYDKKTLVLFIHDPPE